MNVPAPEKRPFLDYRRFIQSHYDGLPGALTAFTGWLTGHETLAGTLIRRDGFNIRGCKSILDAACGNGRYTRFLLREADADAKITAFDLSSQMVRRAKQRLNSDRVTFATADLTRLPYADGAFDAAVCGYAIEHLPEARLGLSSLARVLRPGGKLLLLATEDTYWGRWTARLWHCRTYRRKELLEVGRECGLTLVRELWFSRFHAAVGLGGIIVELRREAFPNLPPGG